MRLMVRVVMRRHGARQGKAGGREGEKEREKRCKRRGVRKKGREGGRDRGHTPPVPARPCTPPCRRRCRVRSVPAAPATPRPEAQRVHRAEPTRSLRLFGPGAAPGNASPASRGRYWLEAELRGAGAGPTGAPGPAARAPLAPLAGHTLTVRQCTHTRPGLAVFSVVASPVNLTHAHARGINVDTCGVECC
ncbi:hypothetical protein E2C01_033966 [Portunus trituberculatus]|uniref:Uncharacterized protein n=1 Tax=Portunus trituberculatus TaxID=210409 RepID=A0A5B7F544_PORTR|nr:hypothetical protein [Portunus trituberculatus]